MDIKSMYLTELEDWIKDKDSLRLELNSYISGFMQNM